MLTGRFTTDWWMLWRTRIGILISFLNLLFLKQGLSRWSKYFCYLFAAFFLKTRIDKMFEIFLISSFLNIWIENLRRVNHFHNLCKFPLGLKHSGPRVDHLLTQGNNEFSNWSETKVQFWKLRVPISYPHGIRICIKRKKIHYGKFFDFCAEKCVYN